MPVPGALDQSSQSLHVTVQPTETLLTKHLFCKTSPRLLCEQNLSGRGPQPWFHTKSGDFK